MSVFRCLDPVGRTRVVSFFLFLFIVNYHFWNVPPIEVVSWSRFCSFSLAAPSMGYSDFY